MAYSNSEGMRKLKSKLRALELENKRLKEIEEKQNLGLAVLTYLKNGGIATDRVLRAMDVVQEEYSEFAIRFDPARQRQTLYNVRSLKNKLVSYMDDRNISGGLSLASSVAQLCLIAFPPAFTVASLVTIGSGVYSFVKQADIEKLYRRIRIMLEADANRFEKLVRAVEELDSAWKANFEYSIHSEEFRKICADIKETDQVKVAFADNQKLHKAFAWFAQIQVWQNLNLALTTRYLYSIISLLSIFVNNPLIQLAIPGVNAACHMFLLVSNSESDSRALDEIDKGILRMQRQSLEFHELIKIKR